MTIGPTSTSFETSSGCSSVRCSVTSDPNEQPTSAARPSELARRTAARSSTLEYSASGRGERP
ncbi:MAG TPA: hypothetical protein VKZ81_09080 [Pseudonocardia sp.]|nr:hypothetical protein [Pseudonocardia sp.]HLU55603.1 hypothetical protein [Pseudonocardia sp.]